MKTLVLSLLLLSQMVSAQGVADNLPIKDGRVLYTRTEATAGKTKDELFGIARYWMLSYFDNEPRGITRQNLPMGLLIAKGNFDQEMQRGFGPATRFDFTFKIRLEIEDGQYRYTLYNIRYDDGQGLKPIEQYNTLLKNRHTKASAANLCNLDLKFIRVFFDLRDMLNHPELYHPSPADLLNCALIKRDDDNRGTITYSCPAVGNISVGKIIDTLQNSTNIYFKVINPLSDNRDHHLTVSFTDGSTVSFNSHDDWTRVNKHSFTLSCLIDITAENAPKFLNNEITKFAIDGQEQSVTPENSARIKSWIKYLVTF